MPSKFKAMVKIHLQMMTIVLVGGFFGCAVMLLSNLLSGVSAVDSLSDEFIGLYLAAILGYFATPWALGSAFQNGVSRKLFLQTAAVALVLCTALTVGFVTLVSSLFDGNGDSLTTAYRLTGLAGILMGMLLRFGAYLAFAALGAALGFWSLSLGGKIRFALVFAVYGVLILPLLILVLVLVRFPSLLTHSGALQLLVASVGLPLHGTPQPLVLLLIFMVLILGFGLLAVHFGRHAELNDRV